MDDKTEEIVRQSGDESTFLDSENVGKLAGSADEEPTLCIRKKIEDLSNTIQTLKRDRKIISDTFQQSIEAYVLLKKKYTKQYEILQKKYVAEYGERNRLYNEVIELKGNIRVFCRCRPLNQEEIAKGSASVTVISPSQEHELTIAGADSSKKLFKFDHLFGPHANQEEVFAHISPIVTSVLDGYNVCILAYGESGTGKTFSMEGTPESRGINYRTFEKLFSSFNQISDTMRYELLISMLEVYNENIRDLLVEHTNEPPTMLEIKQAPDGKHEITGLVEVCVHSKDEVWNLLETGSRVRSVGSTTANESNSPSHCLLRVIVRGENLVDGQRTKSNLWLVDLAGSECGGRNEVEGEGERLQESQFIDKSLSALHDVISALASKTAHVPYRSSKLTHMLQSSLGGDCKALMFIHISPSDGDLGETLCSLNFASRVKGIEQRPACKQTDHAELLKYQHLGESSSQRELSHGEHHSRSLQEKRESSSQLELSRGEHHSRSLQEKEIFYIKSPKDLVTLIGALEGNEVDLLIDIDPTLSAEDYIWMDDRIRNTQNIHIVHPRPYPYCPPLIHFFISSFADLQHIHSIPGQKVLISLRHNWLTKLEVDDIFRIATLRGYIVINKYPRKFFLSGFADYLLGHGWIWSAMAMLLVGMGWYRRGCQCLVDIHFSLFSSYRDIPFSLFSPNR